MIKYYIAAVLSVTIASFAQILLKKSANNNYKNHIAEYMNLFVIIGYLLMFGCTLLTIYAYKELDYKIVAIIDTLGYIFITLLGKRIFNEPITKNKIIGISLIIIGIIIFNLI